VIARTTVQHVERDDYLNDDVKRDIKSFDRSVEERPLDQNFMADPANGFISKNEPDDLLNGIAHTKEDYGDMTAPDMLDANDISDNVINKYLNAELIFNIGTCSKRRGHVVKRTKRTSSKQLVARILTSYSILESTLLSLPTDLLRTILQMWLQNACMHSLTLKEISIFVAQDYQPQVQ